MPSNTVRQTEAPTYRVVTYGCQMNVHDSERIAGLLEEAGYVPDPRTDTLAPADVVVFNTCAVRENADNRLYGTLGHMASVKSAHPGRSNEHDDNGNGEECWTSGTRTG